MHFCSCAFEVFFQFVSQETSCKESAHSDSDDDRGSNNKCPESSSECSQEPKQGKSSANTSREGRQASVNGGQGADFNRRRERLEQDVGRRSWLGRTVQRSICVRIAWGRLRSGTWLFRMSWVKLLCIVGWSRKSVSYAGLRCSSGGEKLTTKIGVLEKLIT